MKTLLCFILLINCSYSVGQTVDVDSLLNSFDNIQREVDKFNGEITIRTPINYQQAALVKIINSNKVQYYLRLVYIGGSHSPGKGLYVLFKSGKKWMLPEQKAYSELNRAGNWEQSIFMQVFTDDMHLLIKDIITDFKINGYTDSLIDGEKFRTFAQEILKAK